jgi:ATP-dependent DNA helicase RecQ
MKKIMNTLNLAQSLELHFGFTEFRAGQQQTIQQLIQGFSSLAIFPTGAGKSLCYQLAATQLPHLTLVVSPLIALMKDQLEFLKSKNISAAMVDASLTPQQSQQILQDVRDNKVKVLMVSVERFKNERFRQFISGIQISMLVVDEAHCISEWGHNFRPDYLKLPQYQQQLNIPLVLLLTATATASVKQDMVKKFDINSAHVVQTGFYRANLNIAIEAVASSDKPGRLKQVLLLEAEHGPKAGIIYVTLQKTAETLAAYLQTSGINACAYHAGLSDEKRGLIQQQFMRDDSRVEVIVATIAFGMGIDKANIRFVIHYDLPKSIENYSQEIGRAGRDGESANCYTLANLDNLCTLENFIYGDTPERTGIETVIESIKELTVNQHWETQV